MSVFLQDGASIHNNSSPAFSDFITTILYKQPGHTRNQPAVGNSLFQEVDPKVEIFLPRYVQFTLEGSALAGGRNIHDGYYEGPQVWETTRQKLRYVVNLPEQPPDFAAAPANPERPVRIHFVTHITMGGVDIYRL